jgi:hypothetical protein
MPVGAWRDLSCLLFRLARGSSWAGPMHRWHSRPHRQPAANVPLTICRVIGVPRQRISAREARRGTWRSCRSCCPGRWGSHRVRAGRGARTRASVPAGGDSTASRPVRSPDHGCSTGRRGFHRVRAGQIPGPRPPHRPLGIPPRQGRSDPTTSPRPTGIPPRHRRESAVSRFSEHAFVGVRRPRRGESDDARLGVARCVGFAAPGAAEIARLFVVPRSL